MSNIYEVSINFLLDIGMIVDYATKVVLEEIYHFPYKTVVLLDTVKGE